MTRRISRITSLALAITVGAVPTTSADPSAKGDAIRPVGINRVTPDARDAGRPAAVDRVTPDARDAGRPAPAIDRVSPDARDNGRRETAPIVISSPALVRADGFDWLDAGIGAGALAALLLLVAGTAASVRTRRSPVRAS